MTTEEFTIIMPEEQLKKTWIDKLKELEPYDYLILSFLYLEGFVKEILRYSGTLKEVSQGHKRKDMDAL